MQRKKVVILGGGTGTSSVLSGLKYFPIDITAIITVSDNGSSTGRLRKEFSTPAVGDIRHVLSNLSTLPDEIKNIMEYRLSTYSDLNGHAIGNLILTSLLKETNSLKTSIEESKYSVHELLTLASIVESEGANSDDRKGVAGVFYNRLNRGEALGSDVTAYYAAKKDFSSDLWQYEIDACSPYNTRGKCAVKGIPVGPISSPSYESIKAAISPSVHDYLFFVADKNKKTYFTKTNSEHEAKIRELRAAGLWYTYN